MEVIIRENADAAAAMVAALIARELRSNPALVLGLATGQTMEKVYACLVNMHKVERLDFSLCHTFNLDEYIGLSPEHPNSYRRYMNHHLFDRVNIKRKNTHLPDGTAADTHAECCSYEARIKDVGGIDLQLLGMGRSGHIGFNEPLSALMSRTRDKALTPETIAQNSPLFDPPSEMPKRALTMGVGTILEGRRLLVLVTGRSKAEVLAKAVEGPITSMITASAMQLHPRCTVIADEEASVKLVGKDYYRWIFDNDPYWQEFRSEEADLESPFILS